MINNLRLLDCILNSLVIYWYQVALTFDYNCPMYADMQTFRGITAILDSQNYSILANMSVASSRGGGFFCLETPTSDSDPSWDYVAQHPHWKVFFTYGGYPENMGMYIDNRLLSCLTSKETWTSSLTPTILDFGAGDTTGSCWTIPVETYIFSVSNASNSIKINSGVHKKIDFEFRGKKLRMSCNCNVCEYLCATWRSINSMKFMQGNNKITIQIPDYKN